MKIIWPIIYVIGIVVSNSCGNGLSPSVNPRSQIFKRNIEVTIEVPDGCMAFYTLDSQIPTIESKKIFDNQKLFFDSTVILKVKTFKFFDNYSNPSDIRWEEVGSIEETYTQKLTKPFVTTFEIAGKDSLLLKVNRIINKGYRYFYTLDGTEPDSFSFECLEPVMIHKNTVLQVIVMRNGCITSDIWKKE